MPAKGKRVVRKTRPIYYEIEKIRQELDDHTQTVVDTIRYFMCRAQVTELISLVDDEVRLRHALENIEYPSGGQTMWTYIKQGFEPGTATTPEQMLLSTEYAVLVKALRHIKYARDYH